MTEKEVKKTNGLKDVHINETAVDSKKKMSEDEKREKRNAYMREYYRRNKEKMRENRRKSYERHKERIKKEQNEEYRRNKEVKEEKIENVKEWREKNREKYNEYQREYQKEYQRKRRAENANHN